MIISTPSVPPRHAYDCFFCLSLADSSCLFALPMVTSVFYIVFSTWSSFSPYSCTITFMSLANSATVSMVLPIAFTSFFR